MSNFLGGLVLVWLILVGCADNADRSTDKTGNTQDGQLMYSWESYEGNRTIDFKPDMAVFTWLNGSSVRGSFSSTDWGASPTDSTIILRDVIGNATGELRYGYTLVKDKYGLSELILSFNDDYPMGGFAEAFATRYIVGRR